MSDLNKTPQELKEIFEWYAEWLLNDSEKPEYLIEWMCDNLKPKALETIVHTYISVPLYKVSDEFNKQLND